MNYETTINFEVEDEGLRITGLELVARSDDGEVVGGSAMSWGGMTRRTRLEVDHATANRLWEAMSDVYEVMAGEGMSADRGGARSAHPSPEALEDILRRARGRPEQEPD